MGAWLAEGITSLISALSHVTDQTSILYDNNCFMTVFSCNDGLVVPQNSMLLSNTIQAAVSGLPLVQCHGI